MQQVIFRLLGPPEIFYKEQPVKIPRRRSRALLYYLVSTQTPQPRERLLPLLCGDVDEESARHTFKTLLAEVRALLRSFDAEIEWIISDDDQLRLNPLAPLWLDTEIFEKSAAVTSRNLNRTLALYRGDFLDGFFLRDAPGFETWLRSTRDHFRHVYLGTLRRLTELYEADNQLEQAITCTRMLLAADPLMEEAYADLMRFYWMMGKRIEALREYERLCEVLAQELAVKPSVSTQSLYEQIARSSGWSSATRIPGSPAPLPETREDTSLPVLERPVQLPFVGRAAELTWFREHLASPARAGPLLLLVGEAGMGKTRLLQEVLAGLDSSWLILRGTCQEVEQLHPYHAVVEALRGGLAQEEVRRLNLPVPWSAQLVHLVPDLFPASAAAPESTTLQPLVLAEALVSMFRQLARPRRSLLLVLDDLHWADTATLALLGHLVRGVQSGSVFLLGAFCPAFERGYLAPLRRGAARQQKLAELVLSPLSAEDLARLVSCSLADLQEDAEPVADCAALAAWCLQHSEGNPFFALAWLQKAQTARALSALTVPEAIIDLVQAQLACLSREALSLLTAAAFCAVPFDPLAASALTDMDKKTCLAVWPELLQSGLVAAISPAGDGLYTFVHASTREVVRFAAGPLQRYFLPQIAQTPVNEASG